jgi:hypothetical protein
MEWQTYLKFHLCHLEDSLHEEMSQLLQDYEWNHSNQFWTHVFKKLFPCEIALDAFDKALSTYYIWSEPLGLDRWQNITCTLLTHKAHMQGKHPSEFPHILAEGIAQQLQRVVLACPEQQAAVLYSKYTQTYHNVIQARASYRPITTEMYHTANTTFIEHIKTLLDTFSAQGIFGTPAQRDSKPTEPVTTPRLQHMAQAQSPSYSQVTQAGGQGYGGNPIPRTYVKNPLDFKPKPLDWSAVAPTGLTRTWNWRQVTNPHDKPKTKRIPCNSAVPPECTDSRCQYYGDWLDVQGICSYCLKDTHTKDKCDPYNQAVLKYAPQSQTPTKPVVAKPVVANVQENH